MTIVAGRARGHLICLIKLVLKRRLEMKVRLQSEGVENKNGLRRPKLIAVLHQMHTSLAWKTIIRLGFHEKAG